eukprot:SAG11_NODE_822_length_7009_cov_7.776122_2_plen_157_part_00
MTSVAPLSDEEDSESEAGENFAFPVCVEENEACGRYLVAARAGVTAGTVALRVAPLAAVPSDASLLSRCCGCLRPAHKVEDQCQGCRMVLLCIRCRTDSASRAAILHRDECATLQRLRNSTAPRAPHPELAHFAPCSAPVSFCHHPVHPRHSFDAI